MAINLSYQTKDQFAARFWQRLRVAYQSGDFYTYHRMIWWVWQKIQDGDLTSNQVRLSHNEVFNKSLTTAQWNTLITTRLLPIKDRYLVLRAEGDLS